MIGLIGALVEVWVATQGAPLGSDGCTSEAFATELRAARPALTVRSWRPDAGEAPPPTAVAATLTLGAGTAALEARGAVTLSRSLPPDSCERSVKTAALIVDGALDELRGPSSAIAVESLAPPVPLSKQLHFSAAFEAGAAQGAFAAKPVLGVEASVRYRFLELTLDGDVVLASQSAFDLKFPEVPAPVGGDLSATSYSIGLVAAFVPRLGPGRLVLGIGPGLSWTHAAATSSGPLFQQAPTTATEPFGALRVGYALDLPKGFFLGARVEGRVAHAATFEVGGVSFSSNNQPSVTTPVWTIRGVGFVGFHFS